VIGRANYLSANDSVEVCRSAGFSPLQRARARWRGIRLNTPFVLDVEAA